MALGLGLVGLLGLAGTQSFGVFPGKSSPSLDTMSKMMIYKDVVSGDEMTSDSFKSSVEFDGAALEVKSKWLTVEEATDDESLTGGAKKVLDIVDHFRLQEVAMDKKGFMAWAKGYMKKLKDMQKISGSKLMKGTQDFIKFILRKYDDVSVYAGESFDTEGGHAFAYWGEHEETPTFYFILPGLKEEKV